MTEAENHGLLEILKEMPDRSFDHNMLNGTRQGQMEVLETKYNVLSGELSQPSFFQGKSLSSRCSVTDALYHV